jgi:hypothetical protein
MKWFKHQTDASEDIKIKRLEVDYPSEGYAFYFKTVEKVGKEGSNYQLKLEKYPLELLASDFKIPIEKLKKIFAKMGEITLIDKKSFSKGIISIPNMKNYADDYSDKVRRKSRQGSDNVRTLSRQDTDNVRSLSPQKRREEIRIDKIRTEEKPSFFKKGKRWGEKPFYNGQEMRWSKEKWWVIPNDGGDWLEYADKESKIEWIKK